MNQNRRRFLRKVPDDIAFIQIERDEVGKVLNISEGGLSFNSITPVPRNLPVYFWFSFNLKDRIEAMGEVTWTDTSRTVGGLKFTQLSRSNKELIQNWVSRLRREEPPEEIETMEEEAPETDEEAFVPQLVAVGAPEPFRPSRPAAPARSNGLDRVARFVSKARAYKPVVSFRESIAEEPKPAPGAALGVAAVGVEHPGLRIQTPKLANLGTESRNLVIDSRKTLPERPMFSMETGAAPNVSPSLPPAAAKFSPFSFRGIESLIELVPLQRHLSAKRRQLICGILLGVGISALVTLPALKFWNSRAHAETISGPALTDSLTLKNNAATQPPASDPPAGPPAVTAAKPTYPVAGVFSDPNPVLPKKGTPQNLLSRTQLPASFWKEERKTAAIRKALSSSPVKNQNLSAETSASQKLSPVKSASSTSASTTTDKKSGMNPTQLWTEVQAGSSNAAVELAERYIKGNGVPRNCQQARVLLLVASEKRNTAAIKRLHDLDKGAACP